MIMQKFNKNSGGNELYFPFDNKLVRKLQDDDAMDHNLISICVGRNYGITLPTALCNGTRVQESLEEILKVRSEVDDDIFPRWFMERYYPEDWGTFPDVIPTPLANAHQTFNLPAPLSFDDPKGLANVVHMDHTSDLARILLDWLIDEKAEFPGFTKKGFNFIGAVPDQHEKLNKIINDVLKKAFEVKYYYGVPRPEEVRKENITSYPEGSPSHPSFPAGHGAVAFATVMYFMKEYELTETQIKTLFDCAYIWAMARSLAGVHYAVDNLAFAPMRHQFA